MWSKQIPSWPSSLVNFHHFVSRPQLVLCEGRLTFLPMRNSGRLLLRSTCSVVRGRASSRLLPYFARKTGSRRMSGEGDRSGLSSLSAPQENSIDSTAGPPAASAAATVVAGDGGDGGRERQDGEWFRVSQSVKLALHRGDITKWSVDASTDAIVNAANSRMLGGGGVDGAIHRRAGPELKEACREVPQVSPGVRCPTGEARITRGFDLPVSYIIHTVGPIYYKDDNPAALLGDAYRNSLKLAVENGIKYVAFPAISCGTYCYPVGEAATISLSVIKEASNGLSEVHFVMFETETFDGWMEAASKQFTKIEVQRNGVEEHEETSEEGRTS